VPEAGLWIEPTWLREADTWIEEHASVTGELDQFHIRWWSTVMRVPTRGANRRLRTPVIVQAQAGLR